MLLHALTMMSEGTAGGIENLVFGLSKKQNKSQNIVKKVHLSGRIKVLLAKS